MMTSENSNKQINNQRSALGVITANNVNQLRRLNSVLFPVHYSPQFYKDVIQAGELAKLCYFNDVCVGAVCCRKDNPEKDQTLEKGQASLYLMTLGVLAPYRRLGLGSMMIKHVLEQCKADDSLVKIYLHVQTSNEDALKFYANYGFEQKEVVPSYYKNIQPADAILLERKLK
ncbi:N-acetyltransferase 5 [Entomophthora muscae]|uniref:N-acetyltransferase 5 n=1 Tax=Entomophthora muscae TaxID=34485 RepID=A0ACC2RIQ2_9FUNG|nr:N-acetyltransferase 5 [Entomophthora muscae]